ncbi:MAG TPA: DUF1343 domain-containing protein [Anaerolineaceae bacterium]|nr:DUF1343 domain-containing protein [Anaerolineaceae bacterium]HPN52354.1 DUF1343 domain-containing protein [Anaerolineaceae bacterium]
MILTGLDQLVSASKPKFSGRLGLVSHSAAVTHSLTDSVSALLSAGYNLTALFGPEHGLTSSAADGAAVDHATDSRTGLPVYSLYGKTREPSPDMLSGIDTLLLDIQDVGVRFYTYISTMYYCLTGCAKANKKLIILDRPNPINGVAIEGPMLEDDLTSFVGIFNIPVRHGLTMGELALLMVGQHQIPVELEIVKMLGWDRSMWFDQTGLTWVPTSPGMPHLSTATVYPGTCFIEGTNLSEGRGTALPFELIGSPWIDAFTLSDGLNDLNLPGVQFRPSTFTPSASKHAGYICQGVQIHVLDRQVFRPVETGLHMVQMIKNTCPNQFEFLASSWEGKPPHFDLLCGTSTVRTSIENQSGIEKEIASWRPHLESFITTRQPYLLY